MSLFLKSSFRHLIISFIILSPVMFAAYLFFYLIGFNPDLILLKLKGSFILHGLRAIFRRFGLEIPSFLFLSQVRQQVPACTCRIPPLRLYFLPSIAREKREQRILKQGIRRENNLSVYLLSVLFPSRSQLKALNLFYSFANQVHCLNLGVK